MLWWGLRSIWWRYRTIFSNRMLIRLLIFFFWDGLNIIFEFSLRNLEKFLVIFLRKSASLYSLIPL